MDPIKVEGPPARPDPADPPRGLPSAVFPDPDRAEGLGPAGWRRVTLYTAAALAALPEVDRPDGSRLRLVAPGVMAGLEVEPRWFAPEVLALPQPTPLESSAGAGIRRGELILERTWWADQVAGCRLCPTCSAQPLGPGRATCEVPVDDDGRWPDDPDEADRRAALWSIRHGRPLPSDEGGWGR